MPRCKYIYKLVRPDGTQDPKVQSGEILEGDQCRSTLGSEKYKGMCAAHGRIAGVLSVAEMEAHKEKKKVSMQEAWVRRKSEPKKPKANKYLEELSKLSIDGFDAVKAWKHIQNINPMPHRNKGGEQYCYALWRLAPQSKRNPKTIEAFSQLVGVSTVTLNTWNKKNVFFEAVKEKADNMALAYYPLIVKAVILKSASGDMEAINRYFKIIKEISEASKESVGKSDDVGLALNENTLKALDEHEKALKKERKNPDDIRVRGKQKDAEDKMVIHGVKEKLIGSVH